MKLRNLILLLLLLLPSCRKEMSETDYFRIQRQKVAAALAAGLSEDFPTDLAEAIDSGEETLEIDFCLDRGGQVRFLGEMELAAFLSRVEKLDGTLPEEQYRSLLDEAAACIHVGMYYDGQTTSPAATLSLQVRRLRDHFGEFLAYELTFRFRNGSVIGVRHFFESDDFRPYRQQLLDLISSLEHA